MKKISSITYMKKDGFFNDSFVFYADKRIIKNKRFHESGSDEHFHWHDYFELEIVLDGDGLHLLNGCSYELHKGSAYIVTPIDFHSVFFENEHGGRIIHIQFDSFTMSEEVTNLITSVGSPIITMLDSEEFDFVKLLSDKLIEEYNGNLTNRNLIIRSILEHICILVIRRCKRIEKNAEIGLYDETIIKVINYLKYNFRNKITIRDVANIFAINSNYLGEKFKKNGRYVVLRICYRTQVNIFHETFEQLGFKCETNRY